MKPAINAITLGVRDLERSMRFYRDGLGLPTEGIIGTEFVRDEHNPGGAVAMFTLEGGLVLSLYGMTDLAMDAGLEPGAFGRSAFSLGYFTDNRDQVEQILNRAEQAGGTIVQPARDRPWGIYAGYFGDPDGHLWEVLHAPQAG
jgi:uncharacterized protein